MTLRRSRRLKAKRQHEEALREKVVFMLRGGCGETEGVWEKDEAIPCDLKPYICRKLFPARILDEVDKTLMSNRKPQS